MESKTPFKFNQCIDVFEACYNAINRGETIKKISRKDKEFHFQDWFEKRLREAGIQYEQKGRNSYPDFTLVDSLEGYEIKGLGWPGREADYDCNSQVPSGYHHDRTIYYVFGRYPSDAPEDQYPVIDLVICHGDFLNADRQYVHKNKSFTGFGSYGDLKIRDRKMYIAPTPYGIITGVDRQITLILPKNYSDDPRIEAVGQLVRVEANQVVSGYSFDLRTNILTPSYQNNPLGGTVYSFIAYRMKGVNGPQVTLKNREH
jgi:hypothetical protein